MVPFSPCPLTGHLMTELASAGRGASFLLSETAIDDGNWHRIGLIWDGLHRTLFVDGVAVAEDTQNGLASPANGFYIGTGKDVAAGTHFSGLIDDVRIYNRAVSP
ncbi:MAG: LamG domain-containing protein [Planctomycetota bacterium]